MHNKAYVSVFDRRRDHRIKRAALLRVSAEMFNKKGYAATSLADIARHFNVSKTALYYYVESKPVLLMECYEFTLDLCEEVMGDVLASDDTGLKKIESYFRGLIAGIVKNGPVAIVHEFASLPKVESANIHRRARELDLSLTRIIKAGIADGSVSEVPPKLIELILMGANNWIQRWYNREGDKTLEEVADCFIYLITNGLKPRVDVDTQSS